MKKTKPISDKELVLAYQSGDKIALNYLVKKWHLYFCKLSFYKVKDADLAKDIVQESWRVIFNKLYDLQEPEKFKSWAISIVQRKTIDWLRANQRNEHKLQKYSNEIREESIEESDEDELLKRKLLQAIQKLSKEQQMVIRLFYTQSYSLKEISTLLNISVGTAKSRLFHAREKLKTIIKH
ncbi:RNA polymerase sigma factor [Tenacibaculum sp. 190130A14a]|uniref:RNA polymerase sigma-70 factor, ECF subfamily n=1 Tax=Tenacibaculum polynesiense TaxID=3137857 RepID=A0ABP1ESN1_9FLAO